VTLAAAARSDTPVVVSAITLTEVLRGGGRDAPIHHQLKSFQVVPVTAEVGREAGELLGRTRRADTVDAVIAVTASALPGPVLIVTSDPGDIEALTAGLADVRVRVV
jgi:predicted nucleic acid-binding protein